MLAIVMAVMLEARGLTTDPRLIGFFSDVIVHSGVVNPHAEQAAFLVRDTRGDVQCLLWPQMNELAKDSFRGEIPPRTIALVHSHPSLDRNLSEHDMAVARELHLPMIVVTRMNIAYFDPDAGQTTFVVDNHSWVAGRLSERCAADWLAR